MPCIFCLDTLDTHVKITFKNDIMICNINVIIFLPMNFNNFYVVECFADFLRKFELKALNEQINEETKVCEIYLRNAAEQREPMF